MKNQIQQMIIQSLIDLHKELEYDLSEKIDQNTQIFGSKSGLDSLNLVYFVTNVEELISTTFDKNIVLTDEKAMSQTTSPFRTVDSLSNYIVTLLEDQ